MFLQKNDCWFKHEALCFIHLNIYVEIHADPVVRKVNDGVNLRFDFGSRSTSLRHLFGGPVVQWIEQWFPVP